jgi:hypothetical protein
MKWEYFGTGLAFIGIGATLMLALPPRGGLGCRLRLFI